MWWSFCFLDSSLGLFYTFLSVPILALKSSSDMQVISPFVAISPQKKNSHYKQQSANLAGSQKLASQRCDYVCAIFTGP